MLSQPPSTKKPKTFPGRFHVGRMQTHSEREAIFTVRAKRFQARVCAALNILHVCWQNARGKRFTAARRNLFDVGYWRWQAP